MKIRIPPLFKNAAAVTASAVMVIVLAGCGLPNYTALASPVSTTIESIRKLSFTTVKAPAGVKVTGYALYYKVYKDPSDYNIRGESDRTSINNKDAKTGSSTLKSRGFVRAGQLGKSDLPANPFNIRHLGSGDTIVLDLLSNADPVAGNAPNAKSAPDAANRITLARGYIDYRYEDEGLRRFYKDWAFGSVFTDGDLRRPPGKQPATESTDLKGTSIVKAPAGQHVFVVAFAVYAVGQAKGLTPISSRPTHLGEIRYNGISAVRQ